MCVVTNLLYITECKLFCFRYFKYWFTCHAHSCFSALFFAMYGCVGCGPLYTFFKPYFLLSLWFSIRAVCNLHASYISFRIVCIFLNIPLAVVLKPDLKAFCLVSIFIYLLYWKLFLLVVSSKKRRQKFFRKKPKTKPSVFLLGCQTLIFLTQSGLAPSQEYVWTGIPSVRPPLRENYPRAHYSA